MDRKRIALRALQDVASDIEKFLVTKDIQRMEPAVDALNWLLHQPTERPVTFAECCKLYDVDTGEFKHQFLSDFIPLVTPETIEMLKDAVGSRFCVAGL